MSLNPRSIARAVLQNRALCPLPFFLFRPLLSTQRLRRILHPAHLTAHGLRQIKEFDQHRAVRLRNLQPTAMHRLGEHQSCVAHVLRLTPCGAEFRDQITGHIEETAPPAQHRIERLGSVGKTPFAPLGIEHSKLRLTGPEGDRFARVAHRDALPRLLFREPVHVARRDTERRRQLLRALARREAPRHFDALF